MNRTGIVVVIILLLLGGYSCDGSDEKFEVESKVKEEVEALKGKVSGEAKKLEEDYRVVEVDKGYEKTLEEEPKDPAGAVPEKGDLLTGEGFMPQE